MNAPERPLMNYYGGKWRLAPWILEQMPPHGAYIEAFGGGLSVFMQKAPCKLEVVNDKNQEVVAMYKSVRDAAHHLAVLLDLTPYSRAEYYAAKKRHGDDARAVLVASHMGVGNSLADHTNGFRNSTSSNVSPARSWANYCDEFERFHNRMRGVIVECLDYADLFDKYDEPGTLWYLDPPYVWNTRADQQAGRGYTHEMSDADHATLVERIQSLKGMVMLSGYDNEIYSALPWTKRTTIGRTQRNGERTEVLWLNPACVAAQTQLSLFGGGP